VAYNNKCMQIRNLHTFRNLYYGIGHGLKSNLIGFEPLMCDFVLAKKMIATSDRKAPTT
jgi:hypothetical protein